MRIHIVQKGDTLWKLAQKYNVGFDAIKEANSHLSNPDLIMPGMKVKIPTGKVQATKQSKEKETPKYDWKEEKKEHQMVKEMPKKKKTPPPSIVEEKEQPIPLPVTPQEHIVHNHPSYHLQKTDMNVNVYKQKKDTEISFQTKAKETPLKVESPIEAAEAPIEEIETKPQMMETKPMAQAAPMMDTSMYAHCYPVGPVHHSGATPYYPSHPGWQMKSPAGVPAYPEQQMQNPVQTGYGHSPHFYDPSLQGEGGKVEEKEIDMAGYGDVTSQQFQYEKSPVQYGNQQPYMYANPYQQPFYGIGGYPPYAQNYAPPGQVTSHPPQYPNYSQKPPSLYYREEENKDDK